jgi:ketosteroid isomerase-like protein
MRKLVEAVLSACVCVALVFADPLKALSANSSVAETLTQLEQDYGDALKAADTNRLNQILDDDWTELTSTAKILTKKELLNDLTSGKYKLESFDMGPMYVKDLGNVAVVQGSVSEKSISNGKESSHKAVWMDVMLKRGDRWVVVRSQTATAR